MKVKGPQSRRGAVPSVIIKGYPRDTTSQVVRGGRNHQAFALKGAGWVERQRSHRCIVYTTRKYRVLRVVENPDIAVIRSSDKVPRRDERSLSTEYRRVGQHDLPR